MPVKRVFLQAACGHTFSKYQDFKYLITYMYIYTGLPTKNKTLDTNVRITKFVHLITLAL